MTCGSVASHTHTDLPASSLNTPKPKWSHPFLQPYLWFGRNFSELCHFFLGLSLWCSLRGCVLPGSDRFIVLPGSRGTVEPRTITTAAGSSCWHTFQGSARCWKLQKLFKRLSSCLLRLPSPRSYRSHPTIGRIPNLSFISGAFCAAVRVDVSFT